MKIVAEATDDPTYFVTRAQEELGHYLMRGSLKKLNAARLEKALQLIALASICHEAISKET